MSQWAGRFRCLFLGIVMVSGSFFPQASVIESPQNTTKLGLEYVGTQACAECHQQEEEAWKGSHHDMAMKHANSESVQGDFDNR
ncbi:multiheme c-type cytochrome, partial [Vibrio diabolicus]